MARPMRNRKPSRSAAPRREPAGTPSVSAASSRVRRRGIVLIAVEVLEADLARRGMADVLHEQVERNLSEPCIGQLR